MTSEEQFDVATVARDDALLDALGRGEAAPADDAAALLLAAWRDDLNPEDLPLVRPATGLPPAVDLTEARRRRLRQPGRAVIGIAAALVGLVVGLGIASANAGPDSPLWPITRVVYEDRADSRLAQRDAERDIARARQAVADARYSDAVGLLDEATVLIGRIRDESVAQRLLAEIAAVRALIPGGVGTVPSAPPGATPGATPAPGATGPAGGGSGGGSQPGGGSGPTPAPTSGGGLPLPPLPSVPLPSLPLPSLPLPTVAPTLPGI